MTTPEHRAPEGGRPVSEMQERIARALYGLDCEPRYWVEESEDVRGDYRRSALAAMKAMRDPTRPMVDAGVAYALNVTVSGAGSWSEYVAAKHQNMMQAEISIAEGGKNNAD